MHEFPEFGVMGMKLELNVVQAFSSLVFFLVSEFIYLCACISLALSA
jgi:hypothetical protein